MIALLISAAAFAQVYDAKDDFHAATNPIGGTWIYGSVDAQGVFARFSKSHTKNGLQGWGAVVDPTSLFVRNNPTAANVTVTGGITPKADYLGLRPSATKKAAIQFKAPETGFYVVDFGFKSLRKTGTTAADASVAFIDSTGTSVWTGAVTGFYAAGSANDVGEVFSAFIRAGETVTFTIDANGAGANTDDVGLRANISLDTDADFTPDDLDNCMGVVNSYQEDADGDGIGDACEGDYLTPQDISQNWLAAKVTTAISAPSATGFELGIWDVGAAWTGEICNGPGSADCHAFSTTTGELRYVETEAEVVPGSKTLFDKAQAIDASGADLLTYVVWLKGGNQQDQCYVWGESPYAYIYGYGIGYCTYLP